MLTTTLTLLLSVLTVPQSSPAVLPGVSSTAGRQASGSPTGFTAARIVDQAGGKLEASSKPQLGMLYPLSDKFFVDAATGNVGVGTMAPQFPLHVNGQFVAGASSVVSGLGASVLGGSGNRALSVSAVVCGGQTNEASDFGAFIGGGSDNTAAGFGATVTGGIGNSAGGSAAMIPGGASCVADGLTSFAAGRNAQALHDGAFVWADNTLANFSSTAPDQFLIRAAGGVGIGTTTPSGALDVAGLIYSSGPTGGSFVAVNPNQPGVNVSLSWLNDVARIRIGGSGPGAQNGFDIQTVSNTSLLRIDGNGNTTANGQMNATAFVQTSDARLKTDVRELEGALDAVRALRGVRFRWDRELRPDAEEGERVGFLAQEVREVVPEAVRETPDGMLAVSYAELVPVLVEALQDLEARVQALESAARDSR